MDDTLTLCNQMSEALRVEDEKKKMQIQVSFLGLKLIVTVSIFFFSIFLKDKFTTTRCQVKF